MAVTGWLIDKSAYARLATSPDAHLWVERIERRLVRIGIATRLEIGYSFRTGDQAHAEWSAPPLVMMPVEFLTERGQHRAPAIPDLLVAATAEMAGLTVLAVDKDFDLIANRTGQPVERLRN